MKRLTTLSVEVSLSLGQILSATNVENMDGLSDTNPGYSRSIPKS